MHAPFVCHCHVPKTGGSALNRRLLSPRYGIEGVYQLYRYVFEAAPRLPHRHVTRAMRSYAAAGHVPYGYFSRVHTGTLHIAVVREPISRTLSFLNFVLNTPGHKVRDRLDPGLTERALENPDAFVHAVLDEPRLAVTQSNVQTRLLSGCARLGERAMDREDLATALANIDSPDLLVGDQDNLDCFMSYLEGRLPPGPATSTAMPTSDSLEKRLPRRLVQRDLAPATLKRLAEANALDSALYERVAVRTPGRMAQAA